MAKFNEIGAESSLPSDFSTGRRHSSFGILGIISAPPAEMQAVPVEFTSARRASLLPQFPVSTCSHLPQDELLSVAVLPVSPLMSPTMAYAMMQYGPAHGCIPPISIPCSMGRLDKVALKSPSRTFLPPPPLSPRRMSAHGA
eukprot:CAMPEP_0184668882 /NCGR_PEP_ID=MMETSP0308-20130426/74522_1 /TAXON_ID=38269 /ORGANISM="Gloeochaete witrockiana, Strain SAG 46.84" /LENGTH=141 /DNA_ID=CAMNT_0027114837 /DNA_START=147 /DNA_END=573 /DNA_ORIENTATION=+